MNTRDLIPDEFPILRGNGLLLRDMREVDLDAWYSRLTDEEAATRAGDPVATSRTAVVDGLEYHRESFRKKAALRWAIVLDDEGVSVGSIGLTFDHANRIADVGAAVNRACWNRNIVTRAGRLVVDYAFENLGVERIQGWALASNAASMRAMEKLGFQREGVLRGHRLINGERHDQVIYAILK